MQVNDLLKSVRATRYTYYNLWPQDIAYFKRAYSYLLQHRQNEVSQIGIDAAKRWLNEPSTDYIKKLRAIQAISMQIEF